MWNAFMNGSALPGGGGAGGGNVPSQGWEFVPSSRMDRGSRGKCRNPLRRISSPPTVFSHIYEPQGGGDVGAGTQLELLRGQMWPGPEPQPQQQQAQHTRLKKKFEDLKKRHVQDKEEWMRDKELLLREVADIQGGENRRILLDLKTVLDEVQTEVKREEERRSELQLQYTTDRCAWELEKAELKCRIAQLEASRESAGLVSGGVQSAAAAAGPGSVACSAGETLHWERAEQRRLLADTRSTAMDLRCRMDHNERDWTREKAELLERFNVERKEWESQLKDMQKKIEELYCEVRAKREGTGLDMRRQEKEDVLNRFSMRSSSNRSSLLSDNSRSEPLSSSSQSEPIRHSPLPGFGCNRNISGSGGGVGTDSHHSTCLQADSLCEFNYGGHYTPNDHSQPELVDGLRSRGSWQQDSVAESDEAVDTTELEAIFNAAPGCGVPQNKVPKYNDKNVHASLQENALWAELSHCSEKKKNTTALNAALKEIARVSEELCSYQDEIRKKSGDTRNRSETLCPPGENEMLFGQNNNNKAQLEVDEDPCDLSQIYADLRALEKENWITSSPDNTWRANREPCKSWRENTDLDSNRETQTSPGFLYEIDTAAPPIPPRKSSQSTPTLPDIELHIPESPTTTVKHCHSPCVLVDRKCSSPSIVRKFGAMLQVNEGKVLVDGVVTSCDIPSNPNCNFGCCHNRWSCDATKFTNSKSAHDTVQKSVSEVNILTAGKDFHSLHSPAVGNFKELQIPPAAKEVPVDVLLSSLEISPACLNLQGSKRNIVLEQKTAEFNKTLFQAEMGRGVEKQERFPPTDACSVGCQPGISATCASDEVLPPGETTFQPHCTDVTRGMMGVYPGVTLSLSASDSTSQKPEVQLRQMRSCSEGQEVSMKQEISSDLSFEKALTGLREATTIISQCEVKHKVGTASVPSRKTQRRVATEALFSEPVFSANTQPGQNGDASSSKKESPHGAKPQPARVAVSLQQLSAENKQRQTTQAGHQTQPKHLSDPPSLSDPSRPGPRMMNDHPWKPGTLAAYPRPEGSRSNYGALERILKSYENAARAQQNHSQQENVMELDIDPLPIPPTLRATQTSHTSHTHTTHAQLSSHSAMAVKEIHLTVQENEESSSVQKNFSRPARPANRRLPSRWASRSSISSSTSTSSSPSTTPVVPPSVPLYKHSSSFTYSQAFHMETVII